jgi:hypothetical protein
MMRFRALLLCIFLLAKCSFAATFYSAPGGPNKMLVADLNHDGKPDVIGTGASGLNVLLNK